MDKIVKNSKIKINKTLNKHKKRKLLLWKKNNQYKNNIHKIVKIVKLNMI